MRALNFWVKWKGFTMFGNHFDFNCQNSWHENHLYAFIYLLACLLDLDQVINVLQVNCLPLAIVLYAAIVSEPSTTDNNWSSFFFSSLNFMIASSWHDLLFQVFWKLVKLQLNIHLWIMFNSIQLLSIEE